MRHARVIAHGSAQDVICDDTHVVTAAGHRYLHQDVTWLPPVDAGTILALALNYADHATELNLPRPEVPALFGKFRNSLLGHLGTVIRPRGVQFMHYENELAVVIGKPARRVRAEDAMEYVKGYTVFNDLVVRDFVINTFRPPVKPKNFDTFGPIGPWWVDAADVPDPHDLRITTFVNGELRQEGNTRDMLYRIPEIIAYVSEFMTLRENDILCTGTPRGISHVNPGDVMELHIEGVGTLKNGVVAEETLLEEQRRAERA